MINASKNPSKSATTKVQIRETAERPTIRSEAHQIKNRTASTTSSTSSRSSGELTARLLLGQPRPKPQLACTQPVPHRALPSEKLHGPIPDSPSVSEKATHSSGSGLKSIWNVRHPGVGDADLG